MYTAVDLFDLSQTEHAAVFADDAPAWEALPRIAGYLESELQPAVHATVSPQAFIGKNVFLGDDTVVEPGVATSAIACSTISRSISVAFKRTAPSPASSFTFERIGMVLRRSTTLCTCPKDFNRAARSMVSFIFLNQALKR